MMENKTKIALKNKSIFITGVAGFIGSNLAKRLLSTVEGVKVVGLDNMNNYYDVRLKEARLKELEQFEKFSFVKGNLADKAVIESIFEQYKPEIVVNLGAQAGVRYPTKEFQNTLIRYSIRPEQLIGNAVEKSENYDLMSVVTICLGESGTENYTGMPTILYFIFCTLTFFYGAENRPLFALPTRFLLVT